MITKIITATRFVWDADLNRMTLQVKTLPVQPTTVNVDQTKQLNYLAITGLESNWETVSGPEIKPDSGAAAKRIDTAELLVAMEARIVDLESRQGVGSPVENVKSAKPKKVSKKTTKKKSGKKPSD